VAHRDYYLALAKEAAPRLVATGQAEWLDRLDADPGHLRAATAFTLTRAGPEPGPRLAAALRFYWLGRGQWAMVIDMLRALLDSPGTQAATELRDRALGTLARLLDRAEGPMDALPYLEEAMAIASATGSDGLPNLLDMRAWQLVTLGQQDAVRSMIQRGLDLALARETSM